MHDNMATDQGFVLSLEVGDHCWSPLASYGESGVDIKQSSQKSISIKVCFQPWWIQSIFPWHIKKKRRGANESERQWWNLKKRNAKWFLSTMKFLFKINLMNKLLVYLNSEELSTLLKKPFPRYSRTDSLILPSYQTFIGQHGSCSNSFRT